MLQKLGKINGQSRRPSRLIALLVYKGVIALFAIVLGIWIVASGNSQTSHRVVRIGMEQVKADSTGMIVNFIAPHLPKLNWNTVRMIGFGLILFGALKIWVVVELYQMYEWARKAAILFFSLILPMEFAQLFILSQWTLLKAVSIALNVVIIWYLWKVLPKEPEFLVQEN